MPQRWLFDFARVKFDLDWRDADESTGDLVRYLDPNDAGIPGSEWQSLWQYYQALKTALECAVEQSRDGYMTDEVWKLDENWWVKDGTITAEYDEEHWVYPTISV
ncbi:hypothetical protein ACHAW5_009383 [Stephanodiscus triporus]|uniref:Uncharacterized protein n=1 Tax=Stephanodiscus triporus TaxID=2934178 RepID=A0ABD3P6E2_9STRA